MLFLSVPLSLSSVCVCVCVCLCLLLMVVLVPFCNCYRVLRSCSGFVYGFCFRQQSRICRYADGVRACVRACVSASVSYSHTRTR